MGKHKEKSDFDEIVRSHVGRYVYNLQNPISRNAFNGKGGQMYRLVYAINPLKSGLIDRIAIPDDAIGLLKDYTQVVIRPNGEIRAIKDNSNGATLGWLIYKIPTRYIVHLDGNPLNFRRENIHDNRKMVNRGMTEKGYWDMSFVGSTRALISLISEITQSRTLIHWYRPWQISSMSRNEKHGQTWRSSVRKGCSATMKDRIGRSGMEDD